MNDKPSDTPDSSSQPATAETGATAASSDGAPGAESAKKPAPDSDAKTAKAPAGAMGRRSGKAPQRRDKAPQRGDKAPKGKDPTAKPPRGGRLLALLALLVAVAAAGFSGWLYLKQEARRELLDEREARLNAELARVAATAESARGSIEEAIEVSRRASLDVSQRLAEQRANVSEVLEQQRSSIDAVEATLGQQRRQIIELSSTDRSDWRLAEAEYLLRLAYQRLLLANDVRSALALLATADSILRELDDTSLYPSREAIAIDMAALRAVPAVDVEGTWLRLNALASRVDKLILFELPILEPDGEELPPDANWQERAQLGFESGLRKLSDYIVIRRRQEPFEVMIDPQWEKLVRQNLRMQLAQAQSALLSGNQSLYLSSLAVSRRWVAEFFDFNEMTVEALDAELEALMGVTVSREFPDISGSLNAVKEAIDERHAARGGG